MSGGSESKLVHASRESHSVALLLVNASRRVVDRGIHMPAPAQARMQRRAVLCRSVEHRLLRAVIGLACQSRWSLSAASCTPGLALLRLNLALVAAAMALAGTPGIRNAVARAEVAWNQYPEASRWIYRVSIFRL